MRSGNASNLVLERVARTLPDREFGTTIRRRRYDVSLRSPVDPAVRYICSAVGQEIPGGNVVQYERRDKNTSVYFDNVSLHVQLVVRQKQSASRDMNPDALFE